MKLSRAPVKQPGRACPLRVGKACPPYHRLPETFPIVSGRSGGGSSHGASDVSCTRSRDARPPAGRSRRERRRSAPGRRSAECAGALRAGGAGGIELAPRGHGCPGAEAHHRHGSAVPGRAPVRDPLRQAQQLLVHQERPLERGARHRRRRSCGLRLRRSWGRCGSDPAAALLSRVQPQIRPRHRPPLGSGRVQCRNRHRRHRRAGGEGHRRHGAGPVSRLAPAGRGGALHGEGRSWRQARPGLDGDPDGAQDAAIPGAEHRRGHGGEAESRQAAPVFRCRRAPSQPAATASRLRRRAHRRSRSPRPAPPRSSATATMRAGWSRGSA